MNDSKKRDPRFWDRWRKAGAVSTTARVMLIIVGRFDRYCDKCDRPVPRDNNAVTVEAIAHDPILALVGQPRHFLPVVENGETVCSGSPSRAQYIEGQPRDERTAYPYDEQYEAVYREAYAQMVSEAMAQTAASN